jgi:hypothetical protein
MTSGGLNAAVMRDIEATRKRIVRKRDESDREENESHMRMYAVKVTNS